MTFHFNEGSHAFLAHTSWFQVPMDGWWFQAGSANKVVGFSQQRVGENRCSNLLRAIKSRQHQESHHCGDEIQRVSGSQSGKSLPTVIPAVLFCFLEPPSWRTLLTQLDRKFPKYRTSDSAYLKVMEYGLRGI